MRFYEFVFIARQSLVQHEIAGLVQELSSLLARNEAELVKYEYWGLLDFAYPIDKVTKGHYCMLCIHALPQMMGEFKRKVKLNESIVRCICTKVDNFSEGDSFMVQANNSTEGE